MNAVCKAGSAEQHSSVPSQHCKPAKDTKSCAGVPSKEEGQQTSHTSKDEQISFPGKAYIACHVFEDKAAWTQLIGDQSHP